MACIFYECRDWVSLQEPGDAGGPVLASARNSKVCFVGLAPGSAFLCPFVFPSFFSPTSNLCHLTASHVSLCLF